MQMHPFFRVRDVTYDTKIDEIIEAKCKPSKNSFKLY